MEKEIIFSKNVELEFSDLIDVLHEKEYFGFEQDTKKYVRNIVHFVLNNDFKVNVRNSPSRLNKFGKKYIKYKANHQTCWYIFFGQKDHRFLINHIMNNHSQDFPELL